MSLDETIMALADPTRRELIRRLARKPLRAGDLARGFSISRPAICKHTRLLARAGLVRAKKSGRERIYELAPNGGKALKEMIEHLEAMSRFWDIALEAFKHYAEAKK
jgi:DNA-binding transcriptional ArsR family regulator